MSRTTYLILCALVFAVLGVGIVWGTTFIVCHSQPLGLYLGIALLGAGAGPCVGAMGYVGPDVAIEEAGKHGPVGLTIDPCGTLVPDPTDDKA